MSKPINLLLSGFISCLIAPSILAAEPEVTSIADAFKNASVNSLFRYRLETVDQDSFTEDALASTLKARLSYKTADYKGFGLFAEFDTVVATGAEQYNSGGGTSGANRSIYPVIADPDGTEVNQAYISYKSASNAIIKVGRQRILLDNQRFVGGVGWRQNEQTYDGLGFTNSFSGTDVQYYYVANVNRIFGEGVAAGDHNSSTNLLNISRKFYHGKLAGYVYSIDNDDAFAASNNTIGLKWSGEGLGGNKAIAYGLEYAAQSDAGDNPNDYSANYYRIDASYKFSPAKVYVGYEILGSDNGVGFGTSLATLHAFNGWTDQFLGTPGTGLQDVFFGATGKTGRFNWNIKYHTFSEDEGSADFGNELDFSVATKIAKNYSVLLKYADFSADSDSGRSDTSKLWIMLQAKY